MDVEDEIIENKCFLRGYNLFLSRVMFGILTLFTNIVSGAHCVRARVRVCANNKFVSHDYTAIIIVISFR